MIERVRRERERAEKLAQSMEIADMKRHVYTRWSATQEEVNRDYRNDSADSIKGKRREIIASRTLLGERGRSHLWYVMRCLYCVNGRLRDRRRTPHIDTVTAGREEEDR